MDDLIVNSIKKLPFGYFLTINDQPFGRWLDLNGLFYSKDNKVKIHNGDYILLKDDGSVSLLMKNGKFTAEGDKILTKEDKEHMKAGHVYDVVLDENNIRQSEAFIKSGNVLIKPGWHKEIKDLDHATVEDAYGDKEWKDFNVDENTKIKKILELAKYTQPNNFYTSASLNLLNGSNDGITPESITKLERVLVTSMTAPVGALAVAEAAPVVVSATIRALPKIPGYIGRGVIDASLYDLIKPGVNKLTSGIKNPVVLNITREAISFAGTGVGSKLVGKGLLHGTLAFRNFLDRPLKSAVKLSDKLDNALVYYNKYVYPDINRVLPIKTVAEEGTIGGAVGAIDSDNKHPIASIAAVMATPIMLNKIENSIRALLYRNSGGATTSGRAIQLLRKNTTSYSGFNSITEKSPRLFNGNKSAYNAYNVPVDVANFQYSPNNNKLFGFGDNVELIRGATYKSKHWKNVNPDKSLAYRLFKFAYEKPNAVLLNRRPKGSIISINSPQKFAELRELTKKAVDDKGKSLYSDLYSKKGLSYDIHSLGDLILGKNSDGKLVAYNQRGNLLTSKIYTLPDGSMIHLGADFGGTGSGGITDINNPPRYKALLIKQIKSFLDLDATRLPIIISVLKPKFVHGGFKIPESKKKIGLTKNNVLSYILQQFDVKRGKLKKIHFTLD